MARTAKILVVGSLAWCHAWASQTQDSRSFSDAPNGNQTENSRIARKRQQQENVCFYIPLVRPSDSHTIEVTSHREVFVRLHTRTIHDLSFQRGANDGWNRIKLGKNVASM
ncbi:hypothetical protein IWZ00DRAFT_500106 [Phyllosticta capitalensis]|uniref:uncharacterized protein n=1 Tax=Phyllosticta capitalensis TaxID=121624 RepID=UPI0031302A23